MCRWRNCGQRQYHSGHKCSTSPDHPRPPHLYLGLANCILGNPCHMHLGELRGRQRALGNSNKGGIALVSPSCLLGPQKPEGTEED